MQAQALKENPQTQSTVIDIQHLNKWYGEYHALKDINLTVQQGECVVLCGPSGSGKSTLIRCISQLELPKDGVLAVLNTDLMHASPAQIKPVMHKVGMVFQHFNLFPHMKVLENCLIAPMSVQGLSREKATEIAKQFLTKVGMIDHIHKYPTELSGGQQQRVAIARALCLRPDIMLFDEPTSALDPEMVNEVLDVMKTLAKEGMTMLCVTHEMGFAKAFSERVLFLEQGQIVEDVPTAQFFTQPKTEKAKLFLSKLKH